MYKMNKWIKTSLIFAALGWLAVEGAANENLKLGYDKPAASWEMEALPIGNGHLGAMLFGGITTPDSQ